MLAHYADRHFFFHSDRHSEMPGIHMSTHCVHCQPTFQNFCLLHVPLLPRLRTRQEARVGVAGKPRNYVCMAPHPPPRRHRPVPVHRPVSVHRHQVHAFHRVADNQHLLGRRLPRTRTPLNGAGGDRSAGRRQGAGFKQRTRRLESSDRQHPTGDGSSSSMQPATHTFNITSHTTKKMIPAGTPTRKKGQCTLTRTRAESAVPVASTRTAVLSTACGNNANSPPLPPPLVPRPLPIPFPNRARSPADTPRAST